MAQVKLGLDDKTPVQLVDYTRNVVSGMTGSAHFPAPNPALSALSAGAKELEEANLNILDLEAQLKAAYSERDAVMLGLKKQLSDEGAYVQVASGGNPDTIRSANMEVRDEVKPIGDLPAPDKISVVDGHDDGSVEAHCSRVRGANSYVWQSCAGNDPIAGVWSGKEVSTRTSISLSGFAVGQRIWVRGAGFGAAGPGDWSAPVSCIVT